MEPFFGLRGGFIRQNLDISAGPLSTLLIDSITSSWTGHFLGTKYDSIFGRFNKYI